MPIKYSEIYDFWNNNPCNGGYRTFPFFYFKGAKVLEIGCGMGNDAVGFIKHGAEYTGIDLTDKAVEITKQKIGNSGRVLKMNAELLDFPNNYFDLVYSFGVIHHAVHPENIINEAYRVLKPESRICIMLYNKISIRYLIEIMFLRKIFWFLNYWKFREIKKQIPHPTKEQWVSINTDNVGCPLSRVYSKKQAEDLLIKFSKITSWTENKGWYRILIGMK